LLSIRICLPTRLTCRAHVHDLESARMAEFCISLRLSARLIKFYSATLYGESSTSPATAETKEFLLRFNLMAFGFVRVEELRRVKVSTLITPSQSISFGLRRRLKSAQAHDTQNGTKSNLSSPPTPRELMKVSCKTLRRFELQIEMNIFACCSAAHDLFTPNVSARRRHICHLERILMLTADDDSVGLFNDAAESRKQSKMLRLEAELCRSSSCSGSDF
jgi:hypothetical protein